MRKELLMPVLDYTYTLNLNQSAHLHRERWRLIFIGTVVGTLISILGILRKADSPFVLFETTIQLFVFYFALIFIFDRILFFILFRRYEKKQIIHYSFTEEALRVDFGQAPLLLMLIRVRSGVANQNPAKLGIEKGIWQMDWARVSKKVVYRGEGLVRCLVPRGLDGYIWYGVEHRETILQFLEKKGLAE